MENIILSEFWGDSDEDLDSLDLYVSYGCYHNRWFQSMGGFG